MFVSIVLLYSKAEEKLNHSDITTKPDRWTIILNGKFALPTFRQLFHGLQLVVALFFTQMCMFLGLETY